MTESHPERRWHEGCPVAGFEIFNEMVDEGFAFCVKCVLDFLSAREEIKLRDIDTSK